MVRSKYADRLASQLADLPEDEALEVVDKFTTKAAETYEKPRDELVHVLELEDTLRAVREHRGKFRGLSTGYPSLDKKMGGMEEGSVTLIAAETSQGKSALATNMASHIAKETPTLYISLEMTLPQMIERLDWITRDDLPTLELVFQRSFSIGYQDLEPLVRRAVELHGVKFVVLDYLQYLGRGMTNEEVGKMSKTIKAVALKYGVAMLVIVSLRKPEQKFKRKWVDIEIEELMGTAAIGYDCDTAIVVSRKDEDNKYDEDHLRVKVLKTRNAKLDYDDRIITLGWDRMRIKDLTLPGSVG